jgi:hypothetical protein
MSTQDSLIILIIAITLNSIVNNINNTIRNIVYREKLKDKEKFFKI